VDEPEDPHHRTFVNLAAVAFLLMLGIAAVFIVKWMLDSEKLQRCILSGRRDCIPIEAPPRP
jgi:hypothetical protein